MIREPASTVVCPKCNGRKLITIHWVDTDMHERTRQKPCPNCNGTGELKVRLPYKDS
jgi:DnaJ-class molecular chaperone